MHYVNSRHGICNVEMPLKLNYPVRLEHELPDSLVRYRFQPSQSLMLAIFLKVCIELVVTQNSASSRAARDVS